MWLVHALLFNFGIGSSTFFCLALIPALCKIFDFNPFVKSQLKKTKLMVCYEDQSFHTTWHIIFI